MGFTQIILGHYGGDESAADPSLATGRLEFSWDGAGPRPVDLTGRTTLTRSSGLVETDVRGAPRGKLSQSFTRTPDKYVRCPAMGLPYYPMTVAAWVRMDDTTQDQIFVSVGSAANSCHTLRVISGPPDQLSIGSIDSTSGAAYASSGVDSDPGVWYHLAGVFKADNLRRLYINGTLRASSAASRSPGGSPFVTIGGEPASGDLDGSVAGVRVWSIALNPAAVRDVYRYDRQFRMAVAA